MSSSGRTHPSCHHAGLTGPVPISGVFVPHFGAFPKLGSEQINEHI